jgi:hypothetical protein
MALIAAGVFLGANLPLGKLTPSLAVGSFSGARDKSPARFSHIAPKLADGRQRAFPTAQGFGAAAKGGRGGRVIFVTTTSDQGDGSLRACIEAVGPRNCVFRVSGTIELPETPLVVSSPYLTIAGETAPGDGIAIKNGPLQWRSSIEIRTHDVIMRHLRIRPGPHSIPSCCSGALGLYTTEAHDIIIDHVSTSWGSDETVDSQDATNVTFQWCIFSEPLLHGGPGKRNRARNMLLTKGGNFSILHSLFALGIFRNPQIAPTIDGSTTDIINNVLYSPFWHYVISFDDKWTTVNANVIGNYKIYGKPGLNDRLVQVFEVGNNGFNVYTAGNVDETYDLGEGTPQFEAVLPMLRHFISAQPVSRPPAATSAIEAYEAVLSAAGATRPTRDDVDHRVTNAVRERTGDIVKTNPEDVGGWPELKPARWPKDEDGDGIADAWELSLGLDPADPADGVSDSDGDGWTNFEEYLHDLAGDNDGMQSR